MSLTGSDILRFACGEASVSEAPPRQGDPEYVEFELLRTTWEAVQRLRSRSPESAAIASVERDAEAVGTQDDIGPDRDVVEAILAEAKDMSALSAAVEKMPGQKPSNKVINSVLEMARLAGKGSEKELAPVRAVIEEADLPEDGTSSGVEYEILKQALDTTKMLPTASPRAETILAVESAAAAMHNAETEKAAALMRAAIADEDVADEASAEVESLRSMLDVITRISPPSPSDASVAAVLAEAKRHGTVPVGMLPAEDRTPTRSSSLASASRFAWQRYAGVAVLVLASALALLVTRPWTSSGSEDAQLASVEQIERENTMSGSEELASEPSSDADENERLESTGTLPESDDTSSELAAGPQVAAAAVPSRQTNPSSVEAQPDPDMAAPLASAESSGEAGQLAAAADRTEEEPSAESDREVTWEAGEDVRALSNRLQSLRERNQGLEWGGPAVALGADEENTETDRGVQAVGVGAVRVRAEESLEATPVE